MSIGTKFFSALVCSSLLLMGCSGGDGDTDFNLGGGQQDSGSTGGSGGSGSGGDTGGSGGDSGDSGDDPVLDGSSNVTYRNLLVFETSDDFSGEGAGGLYQGAGGDFYDIHFPITPIDSVTLEPVDTATADDFVVTVDENPIDPAESFPLLQKVIGAQGQLVTALVFDLSNSMSHANISALVDEAKAYVVAAQAHSDPVIANQLYVVWGFGRDVVNLNEVATGSRDATAVTADINDAIDEVLVAWEGGASNRAIGTPSNLHRAIVESIGRYVATYEGTAYDFLSDGANNLYDRVTPEVTLLSQLVLFSSGIDTFAEMKSALMIEAIESQGLLRFDSEVTPTNTEEYLYKPVLYYVIGDESAGDTYALLGENAEVTRDILLTGASYDFADTLIQDQIDAFERRVDLDNMYRFQYAFLPRFGEHQSVFQSNTSDNNYSLTTSWEEGTIDFTIGTPAEEYASLVEITGPNGELLALGQASLAEVSTFAPATRWVTDEYDAEADYSWSIVGGAATLTDNPDGTVTISNITTSPVTLQVTNDVLAHAASVVITD